MSWFLIYNYAYEQDLKANDISVMNVDYFNANKVNNQVCNLTPIKHSCIHLI